MMQFILGCIVGILFAVGFNTKQVVITPGGELVPRPLDRYAIDTLRNRTAQSGPILLDEPVATTSSFTSYIFHFTTEGKKVTGLAHIPHGSGPFPVIVQFRGYVDRQTYQTGVGTRRSAEVFASNGFVSLAPDFLGYGDSDMPSNDIFEERFQTYTTTLDFIAAIPTMPKTDNTRVGIWGHSNGGQIALTLLEILGLPIPTTLWAPVTKPFPYSILYYTDEMTDAGKYLRRALAHFEELYDTDKYSLMTHLSYITAPMQLHQGTTDDAVPKEWSDEFVKLLKDKGKDVSYFMYPGADHNMKGAWNAVVERDLKFFQTYLRK